MKKPIAFMINKKPMYIKKSWWFLYFTDGSVYFDGRIRIVKRQIRPLRIQIRNNGSPSIDVGRDTINIGISKKKGFLCDRWSHFWSEQAFKDDGRL